MPTIRDVAARLGVDPSTVSRALNGDYQVSSELSGLVISTAKEMGYKLRGRGGRATPDWNVSGIIVPEIVTFPYSQIVHLAESAFRSLNYNTMVKVSGYSSQGLIEAMDTMERIPARCILLVLGSESALSQAAIQYILDCEIPVVLLSPRDHSNMGLDTICFDEFTGMILAVQHLLQRGYEKLGYIGEARMPRQAELFRNVMNISFASTSTHLIRIGNESMEDSGYLNMKELLRLKKLPDAVICSSGKTAIGAIHAIHEAQLRIPEDMAVISLVDCQSLQYLNGGITSIAYPWENLVSNAITTLSSRTEHSDLIPRNIILKPHLVWRSTT